MAPTKPSTQRVRHKLTTKEKERRLAKQVGLTKELTLAREDYLERAKTIGGQYGRSTAWTNRQLHLGGRLMRNRRAPNPWNAFVKQELEEANKELVTGTRYKLTEYLAENGDELREKYNKLSHHERRELVEEIVELRKERGKVRRANPKAMQRDVDASFASFKQEWHATTLRTGIEGFYLAVRGDVEHHHDPKVYFSPAAEKFIKEVLALDPKRLILQFEAFVVSGMHEAPAKTVKLSRGNAVSQCRKMIQEGLTAILQLHGIPDKAIMNYDNYERRVVENWGVELHGWPEKKVVNPAKLGERAVLMRLWQALMDEACKWVKLTENELKERIESNHAKEDAGEVVYKRRVTN